MASGNPSEPRLSGRVIVITGAARGIGRAIAEHAAAAGAAALVLTDRDPVPGGLPCPVATIAADLHDPAAPAAIAAGAIDAFGRIDGLVNAAGRTDRGGFADTDPALWDRLFAVNARAPFFLIGAAIADMRRRGEAGTIVNILSMNAHGGIPDLAAYAGSKAALAAFTRNAAHAHLAERIRVNGINLGWVATETERHLQEVTLGMGAGWLAAQGAAQPLGRLMEAVDCARLATFLLSPASAPMTGACIDLEQMVPGAWG